VTDPPVNYELLQQLALKPHPLLHVEADVERQIQEVPAAWVGEVFVTARTAHHLLDIAGIPQGDENHVYAKDLDARTWLLVTRLLRQSDRLDRIASWHSRETGPGGMVGDYCIECGLVWPCETRRMADGSHEDLKADG
jgi:hypothetical protein